MTKKSKVAKKLIAVRYSKLIASAEGVRRLREHLQLEFGREYRIALLPSCVESIELVDPLQLRQGCDA